MNSDELMNNYILDKSQTAKDWKTSKLRYHSFKYIFMYTRHCEECRMESMKDIYQKFSLWTLKPSSLAEMVGKVARTHRHTWGGYKFKTHFICITQANPHLVQRPTYMKTYSAQVIAQNTCCKQSQQSICIRTSFNREKYVLSRKMLLIPSVIVVTLLYLFQCL